MVSLDWAARVTCGRDWPDGASCPQGSVLILAAEDDLADTVRPRLDAARADTSRVVALQGMRLESGDGKPIDRTVRLADLDVIELALAEMPDCRLLIVDPVGSYLGSDTDSHRDNDVRAVLAPIADMATRRGFAVVVVCHTRKSGSATNADDAILGSIAFSGIARSVLHIMPDQEDPGNRKLMLPGKCNLAPKAPGWSFTVEGRPPRIVWGDRVDQSADDVAQVASRPGPDAAAFREAVDWLRKALSNGARPSREVQEEAKEGAGISLATLKRASKEIGVIAEREKVPGPWVWRLPKG